MCFGQCISMLNQSIYLKKLFVLLFPFKNRGSLKVGSLYF